MLLWISTLVRVLASFVRCFHMPENINHVSFLWTKLMPLVNFILINSSFNLDLTVHVAVLN